MRAETGVDRLQGRDEGVEGIARGARSQRGCRRCVVELGLRRRGRARASVHGLVLTQRLLVETKLDHPFGRDGRIWARQIQVASER